MSNSQEPFPAGIEEPFPAETDQLGGSDGYIPADPLLETGAFIDPQHANQNGGGGQAAEPVAEEVSASASPSAADAVEVTDATPISSRRNRRSLEDVTAAGRPDWLPEGWKIDLRVRNSGATAGTVDRYYKDPVSGKRFRSKNEVLHFLETGSKPKKRAAADGDNTPSASTSAPKKKTSSTKNKEQASFTFNFGDQPEMVSWTLEDAEEDRWSASVDGEKVTESTQKEWAAAFDHLCNHKP